MADGWWDKKWRDDKSWQSASSSSWQWDSQWRSENREASVKAKAKSATKSGKSRGASQDQREFERWKSDHNKMQEALESERRLQGRCQELEGSLWSLEIDNENLAQQLKEAQDKQSRLQRDISKVFREKTDVQLQHDKVQQQLDNARAVFKKECVEMRKENDEQKSLVKAAREQTDAIKRDFEKFKARVLLWTTPLYFVP